MDLHTAVRAVVRQGISAPAPEARSSAGMSKTEQAAFRAWRRRLREKGENLVGIIPPGSSYEWTVTRQPATLR